MRKIPQRLYPRGSSSPDDEPAARTPDEPFSIVLLGRSGRGKSTLVDALVDQRLSRPDWLRSLTVPIVVRHGDSNMAAVYPTSAVTRPSVQLVRRFDLFALSPESKHDVGAVGLYAKSPILANGICLVDLSSGQNKCIELRQLIEPVVARIDIALIVVGPNPAILPDELELIAAAATCADHVIVVFNKIDLLSDDEREVAVAFVALSLARRFPLAPLPIYQISAEQRLTGAGSGGEWDELLEAIWQRVADRARFT